MLTSEKIRRKRQQILTWLDEHQIAYQDCADIAREGLMRSYRGHVYLDTQETHPKYQKLVDFLEYPDGKMTFKNVRFLLLTLDIVMKNAHHDEPGYWD